MAMHAIPDNSGAPTQFHTHSIADVLMKENGIDRAAALAQARRIEEALFGAGWEIIAHHIMDMVIESGGVTVQQLAEANNVGN